MKPIVPEQPAREGLIHTVKVESAKFWAFEGRLYGRTRAGEKGDYAVTILVGREYEGG